MDSQARCITTCGLLLLIIRYDFYQQNRGNMKKIVIIFVLLFSALSLSSKAYATTVFTENFDSYNVGNLSGQGSWALASPSGALRFQVSNSYPFSAPRSLAVSQAQNQVLPIAIYKNLGNIPATEIVNLAFNYRLYLTGAVSQRVAVVDSNNYPICGLGEYSAGSMRLEIPYSTLNANWGYTVGDYTDYGSGVTASVYYYPIIRMNFETRNCSLSLDNGMSWSGDLKMYSGAATGSATLSKVVVTLPQTSTSPSYGSPVSYLDGFTMWTGGVAGGSEVGLIDLSTFSATNSGYLTYNLSGTVGYVSGNLTACEVDVFQQDIYNNSPMFYQAGLGFEGTVILWNTNLVDYTQKFPNNAYIGHGYSEASDNWEVEGFRVHYYAGQNTSLKFDYTCYENYGTGNDIQVYHSQVLDSTKPDFNGSLIATPAGLLNQPPVDQTACGNNDWYCSFKEWVIATLQWFFMPKLTSMMTNTFVDQAKTKAPFAYLTAVSGLSWSFANSSNSALPSFNLVMNQVEVDKGKPAINFNATVPEAARGMFGWVRSASTVIFWLIFVMYISTAGRRLFK